mmetsp:Transcript_15482/g.30895  ORF Transcript_15482/g.30895 Transcript_15482/m.30895 type:complete len:237 (+) Transcript_15482:833-1543(+)
MVPKPRVQQVQHGVLRPPHIQVHGEPVLVGLGRPRLLLVVRVGESEVVPAAAGPLRHGICLAGVPLPVLLEVPPVLRPREAAGGVVPGVEVVHGWEGQRELGGRDGDGGGVVDGVGGRLRIGPGLEVSHREVDGDGFAPIPLPAEEPVPELVLDLCAAPALGLKGIRDCRQGIRGLHPRELPRINTHAPLNVRELDVSSALGSDYSLHREPEGLGKFVVSLVVGRNSHDSPSAVAP